MAELLLSQIKTVIQTKIFLFPYSSVFTLKVVYLFIILTIPVTEKDIDCMTENNENNLQLSHKPDICYNL